MIFSWRSWFYDCCHKTWDNDCEIASEDHSLLRNILCFRMDCVNISFRPTFSLSLHVITIDSQMWKMSACPRVSYSYFLWLTDNEIRRQGLTAPIFQTLPRERKLCLEDEPETHMMSVSGSHFLETSSHCRWKGNDVLSLIAVLPK